jgi:hypothetical protein
MRAAKTNTTTRPPLTEQLADDFAKQAVKTVLKEDVPGLVILDGLASRAAPIERPAKPRICRSYEN